MLVDVNGKWVACVLSILAITLFLLSTTTAKATVRITEDRGGQIGTYVDKYLDLRSSGENVIIDGLCASACTIVLGAVPRNKICVTSHASLGFHAAWDPGPTNRYGKMTTVTNPEGTKLLYSMYPSSVRRWIAQRGGLKTQMIFLRGKQLQAMYRPCYLEATAQYR